MKADCGYSLSLSIVYKCADTPCILFAVVGFFILIYINCL